MSAISEEAAEWLMRLDDDDSSACRAEFYRWFTQSPRHVQEFLQATQTAAALQGLDRHRRIDIDTLLGEVANNVVTLSEPVQALAGRASPAPAKPSTVRAASHRKFGLWAATLAVLALGATIYFGIARNKEPLYTTTIGEQRTLKLPDGSMLVLNTRSQVRVEFDAHRRDVWLLSGEALFTVARDAARPFRVLTDDATVQALGTQFDVHRHTSGTTVAVLEGSVQLSVPHAPARKLSAGEGAEIADQGRIETRALSNPAAAIAWQARRLEFHDAGLGEVVAEFNRYNAQQMRIEGTLDADKRITGVFNADNPQALVRFLRKDPSLEVEQVEGELVIRQGGDSGSAEDLR